MHCPKPREYRLRLERSESIDFQMLGEFGRNGTEDIRDVLSEFSRFPTLKNGKRQTGAVPSESPYF